MTSVLHHVDAAAVRDLSFADAVGAIARAVVAAGEQLGAGPARSSVPLAQGEFLLMPAESERAVGIKVLTIAPDNPRWGAPRVQGLYLVLDPRTLAPVALIDGPALTELRTAAVSSYAISALSPADRQPGSMVVFGSGPQALAHVRAALELRSPTEVTLIARNPVALTHAVAAVRAAGFGGPYRGLPADDRAAVEAAVGGAELVVCATTARSPLFEGAWLDPSALVVAVGSHEPGVRELDGAVFRCAATVLVEDVPTALREAGDVIGAIAEGAMTSDALVGFADALSPDPGGTTGVRVFKSVGMAWEDLAIAAALVHSG